MTQMEKLDKLYGKKTGGFKNRTASIYTYFEQRLKAVPEDITLNKLKADSVCGRDCLRVIDAAAEFLKVTDPSVRPIIIAAANAAVEVFWRG